MKIQKRRVNTKRHTTGYMVGGKWRSRKEAVRLAKQGRIDGVSVRLGSRDEEFISSLPNTTPLYDLPVKIEA